MKGTFRLPVLLDNENLKTISSSYKAQLGPRQLRCSNRYVRNWFCLRELYYKNQFICLYLHGLLNASIADNAMLHHLLSVSF